LLIGIGVVLLVLSMNQLLWQRWGLAVVLGSLGLGFVLAGVLSSEATLLHKAAQDLPKIMLWNLMFVAGVVAVTIFVDRALSDSVGITMPYIVALWLLVVGARFANRRPSVIAIAIIAGFLLLLQCAILSGGILLSPYHFEHRIQMQLLLAAVITTGVPFVWWFLHAKLTQARRSPDPAYCER
jgi:hypothetical protein